MGEQVGAGIFIKITHESVLYRTDTFEWVEIKAKPVMDKTEKNVLTYFSRVVLFHITGFYQ